jgi:hypothetical protein
MTTEATGGTQTTSTGGGAFTLATETTPGIYTFGVDLTNMALGDQLTLTTQLKLRSASSSKVFDESVYTHTQSSQPIIMTPPIPVPHEIIVKIEQNSGAATISVPWALYRS